jgi:hypothetical protein
MANVSKEGGAVKESTRDRASATMLSCSEMYRMPVVNWEMKSRWLNCRGGAFILFLLEGVYERLMVSEDREVTCFQHVAEVPDGLVDGQKFSVVRAVLPLGGVELPREECQTLPNFVDPLL